jgi:hypothetical protein
VSPDLLERSDGTAEFPPDKAMRLWMDRFVDYLITKDGMAEALRAVIASGADPFAESLEKISTAIPESNSTMES